MKGKKHEEGWYGWLTLSGYVIMAGALTLLAQHVAAEPVPNVVQWGEIGSGVPAEATNVVVASVSSVSAAALRADGTLVIWGGFLGATNSPSRLTDALAVAAGPGFGLAVSNGVVLQWGSSQGGLIYPVPPELTNVVAVACGDSPVALRADATWHGYRYETVLSNAVGHRGRRTLLGWRSGPTAQWPPWGSTPAAMACLNVPPGLTNVVGVAAGVCFNAALARTPRWRLGGTTRYGQTNVPPSLTNAVAIAAGAVHCLALRSDGTVVEWGRNPYETPWDSSGPTNFVSSLSNVVSIAAGGYSSLAVDGHGDAAAAGGGNESCFRRWRVQRGRSPRIAAGFMPWNTRARSRTPNGPCCRGCRNRRRSHTVGRRPWARPEVLPGPPMVTAPGRLDRAGVFVPFDMPPVQYRRARLRAWATAASATLGRSSASNLAGSSRKRRSAGCSGRSPASAASSRRSGPARPHSGSDRPGWA